MKRSTQTLIAAGCAAAGAALGAAGWKISHDHLDPVRLRASRAAEGPGAYAQRRGPLCVTDQEWLRAQSAREEVCIASRDGLTLRAWVLPAEKPSHRWAVTVHGHRGDRMDMASYAHHYFQRGWNVLMPDLRGHGRSDGRAVTMGVREGDDLLGWMEFILRRDPRAEIVLHGVSMGASSCLMASGEVTPVNLKAIVSDCAYSSFLRQSRDMFRRRRLPAAPLLLASGLATRMWAGFSPLQASPVSRVRRSATPTLFIHGTEDAFVSPDMLPRLCDACAAPREWLLVPGAGHGDALYRDPDSYWERVDQFLEHYLTEEAPQ